MQEALEESWEPEQKANQDLTEHIQQLQKERESQEEMVRRLKQQHQEEVDELKAKVRSAEGTERRWEANNQAVLVQMEEEVKQVNEKLHNASQVIGKLQVSVMHVVKIRPLNLCPAIELCYCIYIYNYVYVFLPNIHLYIHASFSHKCMSIFMHKWCERGTVAYQGGDCRGTFSTSTNIHSMKTDHRQVRRQSKPLLPYVIGFHIIIYSSKNSLDTSQTDTVINHKEYIKTKRIEKCMS